MNKYKKLLNNSAIFFVGNFGSKILSFLFVRFYTNCLSPSEYGTIDIITSTLGFAIPIMTLCITEAVLRFSIDDYNDRGKIYAIGVTVVILGNLLFLASIPIFYSIESYRNYLFYLYALTLTNSFYQMTAHFSRGCGDSKVFATSGVLHSFVQIGLNLLLLLFLKWGIKGYLIASILSNIITIIYIFIRGKAFCGLSLSFDKALFKRMVKYSAPLIPNSIFWWIMTSSDRYVILYFIGAGENGLYTVANKLPNILTSISSIFFSAWQLSSVEEANSKDKSRFYSKTLQTVSMILLICISFLMVIIQWLFSFWVEASYYSAWECAPLLILAAFFTCLSTYLGTNYVAMKKTTGVFLTTVIGAVLNLIMNIILTPIIGIKGTALATVVSMALTWIIRGIDTRKFVQIHYDLKTFIIPLILVCFQVAILTLGITNIIIQISAFLLIVLICAKDFFAVVKYFLNMFRAKKK